MSRGKPTLDHLAYPSFDVEVTHRFYRDVMGFPLVFALDGMSSTWKKRYLISAYAMGDGTFLDFFTFEGIERPQPDALPKDIRHIALAVESDEEVEAWRAHIVAHGVEHFVEDHGDDLHLYFWDPNGILFEVKAGRDAPHMTMDSSRAHAILEPWMRARS